MSEELVINIAVAMTMVSERKNDRVCSVFHFKGRRFHILLLIIKI